MKGRGKRERERERERLTRCGSIIQWVEEVGTLLKVTLVMRICIVSGTCT